MTELHELAERPNWSTKLRCTCGYESVSKCEQWQHQAEQLRGQLAALTDDETLERADAIFAATLGLSIEAVPYNTMVAMRVALRSVLDSIPETPK